MVYVPGFAHDIFISYAHVDDQDKWVAQFHEQLDMQLSKLVGRMGVVKIWRDERRLQGHRLFDQTIQDAVSSSALFLALTSNGYLASDYCLQELNWFRQKAEAERWGASIGDQLRIFNLLLYNIPHARWPEAYGRTSGFPLHDAEREDQLGSPSDQKEKPFKVQLRALGDAICELLDAFKKTIEPAPPIKPPAFSVFLADTADSLEVLRNRIANELQQESVGIITEIPPPYQSIEHDEKVIGEIKRAHVSVHLLDKLRGRKVDGDPAKSYPLRQVELGLQHAKKQLIWVPQSLSQQEIQAIEDAAYRDFLNQLESGQRGQAHYRFIRESPGALTREILSELKKPESPPDGHAAALLDTHLKDQLYALELGRLLMEKNVQPYINPEADDPRQNLTILEERLKQVGKLIVVFGQVTEEWVRERLGLALQIAAVTDGCPLKTFAVCFAPPRRKEDGVRFDLRFMKVHHFNFQEMSDPATLSLLLGDN